MEEKQIYEIDLIHLCKALLKKWWLLLVLALLCAALMFVHTSFFVTELYQSTAKMYINASPINGIDISGLTTARDLVETYAYLVKNTRSTLNEVAEVAGLDYTYHQLRSMITVTGGGNTEFLEITVTSTDADEASLIANTIMQILPVRAELTNLNSTITPADQAVPASAPSSPNVASKTVLGFLVGLILGAAIVVLMAIFNDKVQSEEWLTQTFGEAIPLLAVIPSAERAERKGGRYGRYYRSYYASYRSSRKGSSES